MTNKEWLNWVFTANTTLFESEQIIIYNTDLIDCYAFELYQNNKLFKTVYVKLSNDNLPENHYTCSSSIKHDGTLIFEMEVVIKLLLGLMVADTPYTIVDDYETIVVYKHELINEECEPPDDRRFIRLQTTSKLTFAVDNNSERPIVTTKYKLPPIEPKQDENNYSFDSISSEKDGTVWELKVYDNETERNNNEQ